MGWLWSSSNSTEEKPKAPLEFAAPHTQPDTPQPEEHPPPKSLTRDEQADADLQSLLQEFQTSSSSSSSEGPPSTPSPPTSQINTSSIAPSALYPTSMSCRAAFDNAFYCQSLGGQWTNVYRYGGLRECGDTWRDFWFCMRTNRGGIDEERRKQRISERYREKDRKYREGKSSEDVWGMRETVLEGAFEGDYDAALAEMKRREEEGVV